MNIKAGVSQRDSKKVPKVILDELKKAPNLPNGWENKLKPIWKEYMYKKLKKITPHGSSLWTFYGWGMFVATFLTLGLFLMVFCPYRRFRVYRTDGKLKKWQKEFTKELQKHGFPMFIKTQSKVETTQGITGEGSIKHEFTRWIAVSVTEEDCEALRREPHLENLIRGKKGDYNQGCC